MVIVHCKFMVGENTVLHAHTGSILHRRLPAYQNTHKETCAPIHLDTPKPMVMQRHAYTLTKTHTHTHQKRPPVSVC